MASLLESFKHVWSTFYTIRLLFFAAGIVVCYFFYGVMQEKIMRTCYGGEFIDGKCNGERFKFEMTLVFIYSFWNIFVARFLILINNRFQIFHDAEEDKTQRVWYALCGICNIVAIVCSTMALRHINYPTQIIAKSCKPIPVMILGVMIAKKRYTIQRFIFIFILVAGVVLFNYKEEKNKPGEENNTLGLILVGMSILADGALGGLEDRIKHTTKPKALNIMLSINFYSAIFLFVSILATQEIISFYHFANRYPEVVYKILSAALVSSFGQVFIYLMISNFGALPCSIATTTRKLFNVLVSVIFFGNPIISRQWFAIAIVFSALFADTVYGRTECCKKNKESWKNVDVEKNAVEMEELKKEEKA
ncbi:hypothetical protein PVAND_016781 [Polypedilum vanderplanki]|uniref:Uncharacterized protein n=1 Tax=Polypedilum vanderplanki TaxID=319348 RepID=A0A9J6BG61_POLVA|nr:hypothetical protein PVAND_016781 [Polypedilum vanderplanki]